jgi:hypothetical protein
MAATSIDIPIVVIAANQRRSLLLTRILERSQEGASPHNHEENYSPSDSAEFVLDDGIDGGLGCIDVQTPANITVRLASASSDMARVPRLPT